MTQRSSYLIIGEVYSALNLGDISVDYAIVKYKL
jgi:hypothetical protein